VRYSGPLTLSLACQESLLTRRNGLRPPHPLGGVTKSCSLFVATSPLIPGQQKQ
jgi:hypothetical protein